MTDRKARKPLAEKTCRMCNKPFMGNGRVFYCSPECSKEGRRMLVSDSTSRHYHASRAHLIRAVVCAGCGTGFTTADARRTCCSGACGREHRTREHSRRLSDERAARTPDTLPCVDCQAQVPQRKRGKGKASPRCEPCRKRHNNKTNALSRQRCRKRRRAVGLLPKKTRYDICLDCRRSIRNKTFGAPKQRCGTCSKKRLRALATERDRARRMHKAAITKAATVAPAAPAAQPGVPRGDACVAHYERVVALAREEYERLEAMRAAGDERVRAYSCKACGAAALQLHHQCRPRRYCLVCRPLGATRGPKPPKPETTCLYCEKTFRPWHGRQLCCSELCGHRHEYIRHATRRAARRAAQRATP